MVIPTPKAKLVMEDARWLADPETEAALEFIVTAITQPQEDGRSLLETAYRECDYEAQRDEMIRREGFAILKQRFRNECAFFQADCAEDGRCRFQLRLADSHADLEKVIPAKRDYFINLLKPVDEWVRGPLVLVKQPAAQKPAPKQGKATPQRAKANFRG